MTLRRLAVLALLFGSMPAGRHAELPASLGAFRVIVHPSNPVAELHKGEVRDLFLRRRTAWSGTLQAIPVDLPPKMDVRGTFSKEVLELSTTAVTTYWMQEIFAGRTEPPRVFSTVAAVVAFVAATPGAIAYVPADTPMDGVRAVRIVP